MPSAAGSRKCNRQCDRQEVPLASHNGQEDIGGPSLMANIDVDLTVNNQRYRKVDIPENTLLVDFLNEELGLTGTKFCCGIGVCKACTVIAHRTPGSAPATILSCSTSVSQ